MENKDTADIVKDYLTLTIENKEKALEYIKTLKNERTFSPFPAVQQLKNSNLQ